jgi:hypothetical protein
MSNKEFTKQELLDILNKLTVDGKISFNSFGELIFDSRFPDELFENAKQGIIEARNDEIRFKELAGILADRYKEALAIQKRILELYEDRFNNLFNIKTLKKQISEIDLEIGQLETEFEIIRKRRIERMGE